MQFYSGPPIHFLSGVDSRARVFRILGLGGLENTVKSRAGGDDCRGGQPWARLCRDGGWKHCPDRRLAADPGARSRQFDTRTATAPNVLRRAARDHLGPHPDNHRSHRFFRAAQLSGSGISNFSVAALTAAFGTPLSAATLALTAYLSAQALGVLAGGFIADMTRRHAEVAAVGYGLNACIVLAIGTLGLGAAPLVGAMSCAGLLGGLIMPSRDMLVRAAAPPGAVGRTFGIVTSGFNIGGMIGPLMFGFIMDRGAPKWVFGGSVIVMVLTASVALVSDRRSARRRAVLRAAAAAE
jgi:hypothetical protein